MQVCARFCSLICLLECRCTYPGLRCLNLRPRCISYEQWAQWLYLSELCKTELRSLSKVTPVSNCVRTGKMPSPNLKCMKSHWSWHLEWCQLPLWPIFFCVEEKSKEQVNPGLCNYRGVNKLQRKMKFKNSQCWVFGITVPSTWHFLRTGLATLVPTSVL